MLDCDQSHRNIYVGNIPKWADDDWILWEFRTFGPILASKVMKKGGNESSYAFVQFLDETMASNAVNLMHGRAMGDSILFVRFADRDKDNSASNPPSSQVQVGNLPAWYSEEDVRQCLCPFGPILSASISTSSDAKKVAHVDFSCVEDATAAKVALHGTRLAHHPKPLTLKFAETSHPKQKRRGRRHRSIGAPKVDVPLTLSAALLNSGGASALSLGREPFPGELVSRGPAEATALCHQPPKSPLTYAPDVPLTFGTKDLRLLFSKANTLPAPVAFGRFSHVSNSLQGATLPAALKGITELQMLQPGWTREEVVLSPVSSVGELQLEKDDPGMPSSTSHPGPCGGEYQLFAGFSHVRNHTEGMRRPAEKWSLHV